MNLALRSKAAWSARFNRDTASFSHVGCLAIDVTCSVLALLQEQVLCVGFGYRSIESLNVFMRFFVLLLSSLLDTFTTKFSEFTVDIG